MPLSQDCVVVLVRIVGGDGVRLKRGARREANVGGGGTEQD